MADNILNIPDGRKEFYINGDESRVIRVNLNDDNIVTRARKAMRVLEKLADSVEGFKSENDDDFLDLLEHLDEEARKEINRVFEYDVSTPVFGGISPFAVVNDKGQVYVEAFLNAIMPKIEEDRQKHLAEIHAQAKASRARTDKYTKKYEQQEADVT